MVEEEIKTNNYTAKNIQVLEGLEAVRKRPGMYIGNTSFSGFHHLINEIVDNSVDESLAGYCDKIIVELHDDNVVKVLDNGRGIPVDIVEKTGLSAVETVYTVLHAGGKFGENGGYKISGGLHGVGASVVNALSEWLEVNVYRDKQHFYIRFSNGGKVEKHLEKKGSTEKRGTEVIFKPDMTIFSEMNEFDYKTIRDHLQQLAFLNKKVRFIIKDSRFEKNKEEEFYYEGGLGEYIDFLNAKKNETPIVDKIHFESSKEEKGQTVFVEVAMQFNDSYSSTMLSFCNNIHTAEGGTHEEGFRLALGRIFNNYARDKKILKEDEESFTIDDIKEGLITIISIKHPNPQYEGQTKTKLGNSEVKKIVSNITGDCLERFLLENPKSAEIIIKKIEKAAYVRKAAKKAKDLLRKENNAGLNLNLKGKLADCRCKNPEESELFIVEGNSAGGSAKNGRNSEFQAILTMRGKVLNVEKASKQHVFDNAEIGNLIAAIGGGISPSFDVSKVNYHKIIIMTDADVDGSHIQVLLLTFLFRFMKPTIENGFVYIAKPPLYKVVYKNKIHYCYTDEELEKLKEELKLKPGYPYQRFKGLGEMNADQLFETTMNKETRKIFKVTIENAEEAEKTFNMLMGEKVEPRKKFISDNAKFVKDIDI